MSFHLPLSERRHAIVASTTIYEQKTSNTLRFWPQISTYTNIATTAAIPPANIPPTFTLAAAPVKYGTLYALVLLALPLPVPVANDIVTFAPAYEHPEPLQDTPCTGFDDDAAAGGAGDG